MPPAYMAREKLDGSRINLIRRWIEQGAQWERHWSLILAPEAPTPMTHETGWARNPVDDFVLEHLGSKV